MNVKERDVVSLEETLAFIKYLNKEKPFDKEQIAVPTRDYDDFKN